MDVEKLPISAFIREAILKTPQGWFVAVSFVVNWLLVVLIMATPLNLLVPDSGPTAVYLVLLPWPFVVLLVFVSLSSPHYYADLVATAFTAGMAIAPYWWIYT